MSYLKLVSFLACIVAVLGARIPSDTDSRVVGGVNAAPNQIPYIASLRRRTTGSHFCGSSIIRPQWVLSAAHCTYDFEPEDIFVVVGSIFLSSGGVEHAVFKILDHPDFSWDLITADVSVVKVQVPFTYNDAVQPILISTLHVADTFAVVSGWGLTNHTYDTLPNNLQTLATHIITNEECRERHTDFYEFVYNEVICTFTQVGQGICMGDSGGSLVVGNYVVGIPSWVIPCAVGFPDVYTRVSSFYDWIVESVDMEMN